MNVGVLCNTIKSSETKEVEEDLTDTAKEIKKSFEHYGYNVSLLTADHNLFNNLKNFDFIFNICERFNDDSYYEPHVAAMLELSKVPFTGSDYSTLFLCNDKIKSKKMLSFYNIPTPKFQIFYSGEEKLNPELSFPLIVKPKQQENSIGITKDSIVNDKESLRKRIKEVKKKFNQEILVEEFIKGDDIEISIIGHNNDLSVLPLAKVGYKNLKQVPEDKIFCYESKWNTSSKNYGDYIQADLPKEVEDNLKETAIKIYKLFNIKDYGRVDFRLTKENKPYVIEVTANPGMSKICSTPESAEWISINYKQLINKIFESAKKRYNHETDTKNKRL